MASVLLAIVTFGLTVLFFGSVGNQNFKGGFPGSKIEKFLLKKQNNSSNFYIVKSQITSNPTNAKTKFVLEIRNSSNKLKCYRYGYYANSDDDKPETLLKEKPFFLNYNFNDNELSYLDNFFKTSDSKTNVEYFKVKNNDNGIKYIALEDNEKEKLENDVIQLLKRKNLEKSNNKLEGTETIFQKVKSDMHLDYNFKDSDFLSSVNSQKYNFVYFKRFKKIIQNVYLIEVKELLEYPNFIESKKYLKKDFLIFENLEFSICLDHVLNFSFKNDTLTFKFKNVYFEDENVDLKGIDKTEQKQIIDIIKQFSIKYSVDN